MKGFWFIFGNLWKLYVGVLFCLTAILLYPFFIFVLSTPSGKKSSFRLFVFWSRLFQVLCLYPTKNRGVHQLEGPKIIVANHTSYLDIFLMFAHFPKEPFLFMGKSEILGYPILKTYFRNLNIPVDRKSKMGSAKSFLAAKKALSDGFSVVIFPEGGIPDIPAPEVARFKDGAFRLAQVSNVPILPVAILNHYRLFSDPGLPFGSARPGLSVFQILDPIYLENETNIAQVSKDCREKIREQLLHG